MPPRHATHARRACAAVAVLSAALACVYAQRTRSLSEIHATTHALDLLPLEKQVTIDVSPTGWSELPVQPDLPVQTELQPELQPELQLKLHEDDQYSITTSTQEQHAHPLEPFLVIGVKSTVLRGVAARQAIRDTWSHVNHTHPLGVRVLFLGCEPDLSPLGDENERLNAQRAIEEEKAIHQDLLTHELQCHDSFFTLVEKTVAFLHYAQSHFPSLAYAMVVDDDVYVRLDRLVALLQSERIPNRGFYGGNTAEDKYKRPAPPIRNPESRYYLPIDVYPISELPPFVAGAHYILSRDIVDFIARNRNDLHGLKGLDDATMAVWLLALQIHPVLLPEFQILRAWNCTEELISYADLAPSAIYKIHSNVVHGRTFCNGYDRTQWSKVYRTIDFDDEKDALGEGDVTSAWEIELDAASMQLQIVTTITVVSESVSLVYVPSSGRFMDVFCNTVLPLLEAKLSILVGRNFCRQHRRQLLRFIKSHDVEMPTMRALLALTRHNLERDAADVDDDDDTNFEDDTVPATPRETVVIVGLALASTTATTTTALALRVVVENLLVAMYPDRHLIVLPQKELQKLTATLTPQLIVVDNDADGQLYQDKYAQSSTRVLIVASSAAAQKEEGDSDPDAVDHQRATRLYLPLASTAFGGIVRHSPMELLQPSSPPSLTENDRLFCASYHNDRCDGAAHQQQLLLMDLLAQVEQVTRLGTTCHGSHSSSNHHHTDGQSLATSLTPIDDAIDIYTNYKFVLVFEDHVDLPGFVSDKIVASFLAGAIPIYYGNSTSVSHLFNKRAFIDCGGGAFASMEACATRILHVYHSPTLYESMRREPPIVNKTAFVEAFSWHPDVADTVESTYPLLVSQRLAQLLG